MNQGGFVTGRMISKNVVLAQELVHNLNKRSRGANVIMKVDMAKAFDQVSWGYLLDVLKAFGFADTWVTLIKNAISSPRYSVKINGVLARFFTPSRGLRQGDPLSPLLFILREETLSRGLTKLLEDGRTAPYQLINVAKSSFIVHKRVATSRKRIIATTTGFKESSLPFTYLGAPLHYGKPVSSMFTLVLDKIRRKLAGWKRKLLSMGDFFFWETLKMVLDVIGFLGRISIFHKRKEFWFGIVEFQLSPSVNVVHRDMKKQKITSSQPVLLRFKHGNTLFNTRASCSSTFPTSSFMGAVVGQKFCKI
ncbi:unnamed protein product [Fraxinus pennsylvanica]|uniref:Reverse transcriptase domain-containing protein n=1 Tax=Fraxinus pennsylvanica TaxID=56036 RepID=A0AAD1YTU6_9LAMI|nr:unnamed protein product [Fraxinus pennsylvanica]